MALSFEERSIHTIIAVRRENGGIAESITHGERRRWGLLRVHEFRQECIEEL
jgi:hypothetical protein